MYSEKERNFLSLFVFDRHFLTGPLLDASSEVTVAFITGGLGQFNNAIFPRSSGCSLPPSHGYRNGHVLFTTLEPRPRIASCGGVNDTRITESCLLLNQETQTWEGNIMSDLVLRRRDHAVVSLNNIGTFILGGWESSDAGWTTDFLAQGSLEWVAGARLPLSMWGGHCAVQISPLSFLAIVYGNIREYLVNVDNPVSDNGWQDGSKWPRLKAARSGFGCTMINKKVVIAGGYDWALSLNSKTIQSTEILDIETRKIEYAGDLNKSRSMFHIVTITSGGIERVLALGEYDYDSRTYYNSVEEFNAETLTWSLTPEIFGGRRSFGAVAVPKSYFCQT